MGNIHWAELFPTRLSGCIFVGYIFLFVAQGILVTASKDDNNSYSYNTVTVVLLTEALKLVVSSCLYCRENSLPSLLQNVVKDCKVLLLYFVPAFLYCLYNNLAFYNLAAFDPTTYFLLLQLRVVITGVLFQFIFHKQLSRKQWFSLVLLTFGCMIKQVNLTKFFDQAESTKSVISIDLNFNLVFLLVQTICSCLAGVYNEYLLKKTGPNINIYVQNVFMYLDSIICNLAILMMQGQFFVAFSATSLKQVLHFKVLIIMVNNCAVGIVTSFFLKHMNSILKTFASSLELVFTAVLSYVFFAIPIYLNTFVAITIVSLAVYLYSCNPVSPVLPIVHRKTSIENKSLLADEEDEMEQMDRV